MMFKEQLIIVRHARSTNNLRETEDADAALTEYGCRQAINVGKFCKKHLNLTDFSFYTSPFLRALATAAGMQKEMGTLQFGYVRHKVKFVVEPGLREYINHCHKEVMIRVHRDRFPEFDWTSLRDAESLHYKEEFNEELLNRIVGLYRSLPDKSVVVTHGLPAFTLLKVASVPGWNSVPIWDHSLDNASITLIVNGRIIWHGRNLYHEIDRDPFDKSRPYDASDLLVPTT